MEWVMRLAKLLTVPEQLEGISRRLDTLEDDVTNLKRRQQLMVLAMEPQTQYRITGEEK